jgi:hypothetical protein
MAVEYGAKFPKYLSNMFQIVGIESDAMGVFFFFLFLGKVHTLFFLASPFITYLYVKFKSRNARGYFKHLMYRWGLLNFDGLPTYFHHKFRE